MEAASNQMEEDLRRCTVRLGTKENGGTGFFVAPGRILTCTHVVKAIEAEGDAVDAWWENKVFATEILETLPPAYPDLSLLGVELAGHPVVRLDTNLSLGDRLYSYGYPDDYREGDSSVFEYEGPSQDGGLFLKLKAGQARPGLSGAPVLNLQHWRRMWNN